MKRIIAILLTLASLSMAAGCGTSNVNVFLTVSMLGMMLSGIMLARDIFRFLPLRAGRLKKYKKLRKSSIWVMRCITLGISLYGVYAFVRRELVKHMFLTVQYAFFEFGESFMGFLLDYTAILMLCATISHYLKKQLEDKK